MKYRILHFVPGFDHGGIESRLIDWYHKIDRSKYQFDLLKLTPDDNNSLIMEFKTLGGNVYTIPKFNIKNYVKFRLELKKFFREHKYDAVHCHSPITGKFVLEEAQKSKIPIRIMHSRTVKFDTKSKFLFYREYLKKRVVSFSNTYFSCSKEAGEWMFGAKSSFKIINNGIRTDNFIFNLETRQRVRKELNLKDSFVIGNVSRFTQSKNHDFLVDLLYEIDNRGYNNCRLLLLGDGPTKMNIKERANEKGLLDKVVFLGKKENVWDYYQAMDIFVFPSEFEGFGTVAVESQASGLKTIVSTGVPMSVNITNLIKHLPLEIGIEDWADEVIKSFNYKRDNRRLDIINKGFDVSTTVKELEIIYSGNNNKPQD
ncbi:glycosyltransferase [Metabacillus litoralis]|uniref:glycosyltransferase n=1 Tax=Metabacillus litoralis TaxID=152268 RepID=UPI001CFE118B|nr:glycosyltransferase [Metabacillus litoralis]